jgi:translocation and assembly module TamA
MHYVVAFLGAMFLLAGPLRAQQKAPAPPKFTLAVQASAADEAVLKKYSLKTKTARPDSLTTLRDLRTLVLQLQKDAYLTASVDTFYFQDHTLHAQVFVGERYEWARLRNGNLGEGLLIKAGFREKFYRDTPLRPAEVARLQETILDHAENSGYPFASVRLDSIRIDGTKVEATVVLDKGPLITFDSVQVHGQTKTSARFLTRYTQVYPGQPYEHRRIESAHRLLRQLPYLRVNMAPQVRFARDKARVYYFVDDKKANQFDGIIGFLPDPTSRVNKLLITGELNLNVRNLMGGGKQMGLQWRKVDRNSQLLDATYLHPNLLGSPFELGASFNLFKQDTTFLTLRPRLQLSYHTSRHGKVSFFGESRSSRLLATSHLRKVQTLPDFADVQYTSYGVNYLWNNLDDFYFPRRGLLTNLQVALGNRTIQRNAAFENQKLYDSLALKTTMVSASFRTEHYLKLGRNSVLLSRLRAEGLLNDRLFLNDMYRLGGLNSLRGFDDFSFFASSYAVATAEYRVFMSEDSYVLLFYDQGYYRSDLPGARVADVPFGFGTGVSFSTGAGMFQFVYSLGRSREQRINLNTSKIHFGITSTF